MAANDARPKQRAFFLNVAGLIFFMVLALWTYSHLSEMEEGSVELNTFLSVPYSIFGKWGVISIWLALAYYNFIRMVISLVKNPR